MSKYFNLSKSTNEFKSLLFKYKNQVKMSKIPNEDLQKILDMKKLQVERSETEEEFIIREMKSNQLFFEEMKNTYGNKVNGHQKNKDIQNVKNKVESKNKLQKQRFFIDGSSNHLSTIKEKDNNELSNTKKCNKIINLPMIFPKHHHQNKNIVYNTEKIEKSKPKVNLDTSSISLCVLPLRQNKKLYLSLLDSLRNEYRSMSEEIKGLDEMENEYIKANTIKIKNLKRKMN